MKSEYRIEDKCGDSTLIVSGVQQRGKCQVSLEFFFPKSHENVASFAKYCSEKKIRLEEFSSNPLRAQYKTAYGFITVGENLHGFIFSLRLYADALSPHIVNMLQSSYAKFSDYCKRAHADGVALSDCVAMLNWELLQKNSTVKDAPKRRREAITADDYVNYAGRLSNKVVAALSRDLEGYVKLLPAAARTKDPLKVLQAYERAITTAKVLSRDEGEAGKNAKDVCLELSKEREHLLCFLEAESFIKDDSLVPQTVKQWAEWPCIDDLVFDLDKELRDAREAGDKELEKKLQKQLQRYAAICAQESGLKKQPS